MVDSVGYEKSRAETRNTIDVPSVDEFSEKISKTGGKLVRPKMAVRGVGGLPTARTQREHFWYNAG